MKCEWCNTEFFPSKPWQRFCSSQHRDAFHNHQKSEERREDRINGRVNGPQGERNIDLTALGFVRKVEPIKRRGVA